eukprot:12204966-Heterocapsa_arctica.AAC.2
MKPAPPSSMFKPEESASNIFPNISHVEKKLGPLLLRKIDAKMKSTPQPSGFRTNNEYRPHLH